MAKIKHTKTELKAQREALKRFERYLPMLQLKKQQLQTEIQTIDHKIAEQEAAEKKLREDVDRWVALFAEPIDMLKWISVDTIRTSVGNIAGVAIPMFEEVVFTRQPVDLHDTPAWVDEGLALIEALVSVRAAREIYQQQRRLIAEELRTTTQRVNLFEKVKIPECREHIRVIRIFLGDEQTAGVARAKIAKGRGAA